MANPYHLVSRDAQQALTDFSVEFDRVFAAGGIDQWAANLGHSFTSRAIQTTYPIPVGAAGYKRRGGDDALRRLYTRSLSIRPVEWSDGVEELRSRVEAPDFIGWSRAPEEMALEALRHGNVLVADVLATNPLLDFYRDELPGGSVASTIRLFAGNHPVNVFDSTFGTFDNDHDAPTGSFDAALVRHAREHFRAIKAPNGRPMGLRLGGFLVPAKWEEPARDQVERDVTLEALANIAGTENVAGAAMPNRVSRGVQLIAADELTGDLPSGTSADADLVYAYGVTGAGSVPPPWILQDGGSPEEIVYDTSDSKYKDAGLIGVKRVLLMGAAACLPHAIVRYDMSPA